MGAVYNRLGGAKKPTLISKSITNNGTYNAASDNADGFSSVSVNVPSLINLPCSFTWSTSGQLIPIDLSNYSYIILKVKNVTPSMMLQYSKDLYIAMPVNSEIVYSGWQSTHYNGVGFIFGNVLATFHCNSTGVYIDSFDNSNPAAVYNSLEFVALYGIK